MSIHPAAHPQVSRETGAQRGLQVESPEGSAPKGHRYVVAIGINRYANWPTLTTAVNDATGFVSLLQSKFGYELAFPILMEQQATRSNIEALIEDDLRGKLTADDDLVIFFAGHGTTRRDVVGGLPVETGFLVPYEAHASGPRERWSDYIQADQLLDKIGDLPARHILVILDSCHSGLALGAKVRVSRGDARFVGNMERMVSRTVITSAQGEETAADGGPVPGHSLFTGTLLRGLQTGLAEDDRKGWVSSSHLGVFVQHEVAAADGSKQTPVFGRFAQDGQGDLVLFTPEAAKDLALIRAAAESGGADIPHGTSPSSSPAFADNGGDPLTFAQAQVMIHKSPIQADSPWQLKILFSAPAQAAVSFSDPALSIAFHKADQAWLTKVTDRQGSLWQLNADDLGDSAMLCFTAMDRQIGKRRQWTQRYSVQYPATARANFIPEGDPTLALATDAPCDGVTQVRSASTYDPMQALKDRADRSQRQPRDTVAQTQQIQEETARRMQELQEKSKESQAAMADARQKTLSDPKYFGKISASASKSDRIDGGRWQLTVFAQTLRPNDYDEAKVQAVLISPGKPDLPINLTERRNGSLRTFVASVDRIGTKVVVCFSAREPAHPEPLRMTESFNVETYAAAEYGANGKQASFVPSAPATLSPVSNAPCGAQ